MIDRVGLAEFLFRRREALQPEDIAAACLFILSLPPRAWTPELLLYPGGL